jgi:hypothetical protein
VELGQAFLAVAQEAAAVVDDLSDLQVRPVAAGIQALQQQQCTVLSTSDSVFVRRPAAEYKAA